MSNVDLKIVYSQWLDERRKAGMEPLSSDAHIHIAALIERYEKQNTDAKASPDDSERLRQKAIDYALIVEQFQKLLGVYTTTEALAKTAVLMREDELNECTWTQDGGYDGDGNWNTSCGQTFVIMEGTPKENGMIFCCYCGSSLVEKLYEPEPEDEE